MGRRAQDSLKQRSHRAIQVVVLSSGIAAIATVFAVSMTVRDSETSLSYGALVSYVTYALSSAILGFSIPIRPWATWPASYLFAMLPAVLLTSWMPITASWASDLPANIPRSFAAAACVISNVVFCYASAWILLWLRKISNRQSLGMQIALIATAIATPVAFWFGQVWTGLRAKGL
jgi:hypothetical protein